MSVSCKLRTAAAPALAAVTAVFLCTDALSATTTEDISSSSPNAIVGTGAPSFSASPLAIVGTGKPLAYGSATRAFAIVGTGTPRAGFDADPKLRAIVGTGSPLKWDPPTPDLAVIVGTGTSKVGVAPIPKLRAIVGTGAPAPRTEDVTDPAHSPLAIVGTGFSGRPDDHFIQAIVGTGTPKHLDSVKDTPQPSAIVGTGFELGEAIEAVMGDMGCSVSNPVMLGQIEEVTGKSDFRMLGQHVHTSVPITLTEGAYIALSGVIVDSGVVFADQLTRCNAQYVPGASPTLVTGVLSRSDSGSVSVGELLLDTTQLLAHHPTLNLPTGDLVSFISTMPDPSGPALVERIIGY